MSQSQISIYTFQLITAFSGLALIDIFKPKMPDKARWWYIHTCLNALVVITAFNDTIRCFTNPTLCFTETWSTSWPCMLTFAGHLYHVVFFRNLHFMDWVHHILMVFLMIPITLIYQCHIGSNYASFGLSGLPGGIDYLLLTLVKCNKLDPMVEKSWNVQIQTWFRMPFLILGTVFWYIQWLEGTMHWTSIISVALTYWNAIFFMKDTVCNFSRKYDTDQMKYRIYENMIEHD
jgi:hypothetical protein